MSTKNIFDLLFETYNKDNQFILVQPKAQNKNETVVKQHPESMTLKKLIFLALPSPSGYVN